MSPDVWCGPCAGLGAVDAGRVRDLGLPSFGDPLRSVEAVVEPSGSKKAGSFQALFTRTIFSSGGAGISQRSGPVPQSESRKPPAAKRRRVAPCFAWNDGKSCVATPCRYSHICSRCGGEHRKTSCPPPPTDNPSVPANSSV